MPLLALSFLASVQCAIAAASGVQPAGQPPLRGIEGAHFELNDNGAWSWFMDERAIVDHGRLLVGSVRANGKFEDADRPGWGNVELTVLDLNHFASQRVVLHEHLEQDDHNAPGLLVLRDGRYLAAYSKHNQEPRLWFRISQHPRDPTTWQAEVEVTTP